MDWCTIESDPGIFTELIEHMGVRGVQVEELWSIDRDLLRNLEPVYGLIFLFKYRNGETDTRPCETEPNPNIFFANQVINNACATQAILAILMNAGGVHLGEELQNMKDFTREFPSDLKGLAISNSEKIRTAHNSFAAPEAGMMDSKGATGDEELFHFISYVPVDGALYELDGLKKGPIKLASLGGGEDWLEAVCPAIQQRIERYAASEIKFNLMALVQNRTEVLKAQLSRAEALQAKLHARLSGDGASGAGEMDVDGEEELPSDPDAIRNRLTALETEIVATRMSLADEEQKHREWKMENVRRKHNFVPFIFEFLKVLAEKGQLNELVDQAVAKRAKR